MGGPRLPIIDRFMSKFRKEDGPLPTQCWMWTAATVHGGYGHLGIKGRGKTIRAHRFSYQHFIGPIPDGIDICHRCDRPGCVNPEHLFAGTPKENTEDARRKNRLAVGSRLPQAKLTEADVRAIRSDSRPQSVIAKEYGIAQSSISFIKSRRNWAHVK